MTKILILVLMDSALVGVGIVIGWILRGAVKQAQWTVTTIEPTAPREIFCPRCSRMDGSHTTACERARLDHLVAPARRRDDSLGARGQDGSSQTPPVRRSDGRG